MSEEVVSGRLSPLERVLDRPERALLWLPWPSTPRIVLMGSLGFLRQILRSRALSLRSGDPG